MQNMLSKNVRDFDQFKYIIGGKNENFSQDSVYFLKILVKKNCQQVS